MLLGFHWTNIWDSGKSWWTLLFLKVEHIITPYQSCVKCGYKVGDIWTQSTEELKISSLNRGEKDKSHECTLFFLSLKLAFYLTSQIMIILFVRQVFHLTSWKKHVREAGFLSTIKVLFVRQVFHLTSWKKLAKEAGFSTHRSLSRQMHSPQQSSLYAVQSCTR